MQVESLRDLLTIINIIEKEFCKLWRKMSLTELYSAQTLSTQDKNPTVFTREKEG